MRDENALSFLVRSAAMSGQAPALRYQTQCLTYGEVGQWVDRFAATLVEHGVGAGDRVAVLGAKAPHVVMAGQAVLRADGVFVMLDVRAPASRLAAICRDCDITVVCGDQTIERHRAALAEAGVRSLLRTDTIGSDSSGAPGQLRPVTRGGDDDAALLYTSGSTGVPKAVRITHRNIMFFTDWAVPYFGLTSDEILLNQAHLSFDISTLDIFGAFAVGACVVLLDDSSAIFPQAVVSLIRTEQITNLYVVSSALAALVHRGGLLDPRPASLRRILYGGEVLAPPTLAQVRAALPSSVGLFNVYGPLESNIVTVWPVPADSALPDPTPIGWEVPTARAEVRGADGAVVAPGVVGELWVGGPTLSPGYWRRSELTGSRFVTIEGQRWYRTGDRGRRDEHGLFHFHGRDDDLVKRRGFRIELGDIESALASHPEVLECAVVATAGAEIHAWFCLRPGAVASSDDLRSYLVTVLPAYMLPDSLTRLDDLPRTARDKVDRTRLRAAHQ